MIESPTKTLEALDAAIADRINQAANLYRISCDNLASEQIQYARELYTLWRVVFDYSNGSIQP